MKPLDKAEAYLEETGLIASSGAVLYSSEATLVPGPVYLLGLNAGGTTGGTLAESLRASRSGHNAYLDEAWTPGGRTCCKGEAPLQRRVQMLCKAMGLETRNVPASNLAFTRSTGIASHPGIRGAIEMCDPVHRIFMAAIRPRFVMTFGSLKHFANGVHIEHLESMDARHGNWRVHRGTAHAFGRRVEFGNVPHLSFWACEYRAEVLDWVVQAAA